MAKTSRKKLCVAALTLLGSMTAVAWIISCVHYAEMVDRSQASWVEYWFGYGEIGGRWTSPLTASGLSRQPNEITATLSNGQSFTTSLPTTLWEFELIGLELTCAERRSDRDSSAKRWIEARVPLWIPSGLFLAYPCLFLATGPVRSLAARTDWFAFIAWLFALVSIGGAGLLLTTTLIMGARECPPRYAAFFGSPGILLLLILWLCQRRSSLQRRKP